MRVHLLDARRVVAGHVDQVVDQPSSGPPPPPVRPTVTRPRALATRRASTTLGERPDVLMPMATSPGRPCASTCRRKTAS